MLVSLFSDLFPFLPSTSVTSFLLALLLVPTLAPRLECAQLPLLLSMLDRWRRPWRRSLSRQSSALRLSVSPSSPHPCLFYFFHVTF